MTNTKHTFLIQSNDSICELLKVHTYKNQFDGKNRLEKTTTCQPPKQLFWLAEKMWKYFVIYV